MNKSQDILHKQHSVVANLLQKAYHQSNNSIGGGESEKNCFKKVLMNHHDENFKKTCGNDQQAIFEFNYEFYLESDGVINAVYFIWIKRKENDSSSFQFDDCSFIYNEKCQDKSEMELVLKVNTLHDSWARSKTMNEVSIMQFLKSENFPVPQIFDYELSCENLLGFEYILMEKVKGVPLRQLCTRMDVDERSFWIDEIGKYLKEIYKMNFVIDAVSFDLSNDEMDRSEYIVKEVDNTDAGKLWLGGSFHSLQRRGDSIHVKIGPYVDSKRGPFESIVDYWKSLVEFRYPIFETLEEGRFAKYIPLMKKYVDKYFGNESPLREECTMENCKLFLCHGDLSTSNVIVCAETKKIKAIIDFEWAKLSVIEEDMRNILEDWCLGLHSLEGHLKSLMKDQTSSFYERVLFHFKFIDLLSCVENYKQFHSPEQQENDAKEFIEMIIDELDELLEQRL